MDFKQFYLSAQGRVNRKQWWLKLILPVFVISIILAFVDMSTGHFDPQNGIGLFSSIFALLILIPAILVYVKRFHDRDKSGWWILIALIPIIGAIWMLIELGFLAGTPGPNRFGLPPFYSLHVWAFKHNPAGMFEMFNPNVHCNCSMSSMSM